MARNLSEMASYADWRHDAELVAETRGSNKGHVHVRLLTTGQVLCGLSSALVETISGMPSQRGGLPAIHIACLGRVPR